MISFPDFSGPTSAALMHEEIRQLRSLGWLDHPVIFITFMGLLNFA